MPQVNDMGGLIANKGDMNHIQTITTPIGEITQTLNTVIT